MKKITNDWFYSNPWKWAIPFLVYVKGDALVLIPLVLVIILISFINLKIAVTGYLIFFVFRALGEMIYWLLQQFHDKFPGYRPNDFGFTELGNNSIYIIYQTLALAWMTIGTILIILLWRG